VVRLTVYYTARLEPFDSPLIPSRSKNERLAQDRPFDSPLIPSRSKDEPLAQDRPFDSPLILSRSKDEPLAQDRPFEGRAFCSWFDKLTTSVYVLIVRTHQISAHTAVPD
jgi:hypothetical protein